nr:FCD domain-containing protein [Phyllobacterium sp. IY22]
MHHPRRFGAVWRSNKETAPLLGDVTEEALGEHQTLPDAFATRDPDAAANAMRIHIELSRDRLLSAFDEI